MLTKLLDKKMRLLFAGTPEFAVTALEALVNASYPVQAVYTQPDRPAGRGRHLTPSPVKAYALAHHIPVHQPLNFREPDALETLASYQADILVVAAYGILLPKSVLHSPRLGCINIHASLLPLYRGAAPIQRAILAGDAKTGVSMMQMEEGLDTGPVLFQMETPILPEDTSQSLHDRLAKLGARALLITLERLPELKPLQQNQAQATYAAKIHKEEARLHWHLSAENLLRQIHAFNPWPGAYTHCDELLIKIWEGVVITTEKILIPGTIINTGSEGIDIATGKNILRITKMQLPGGRILSAADILNARQKEFAVGKILT